LAKDDQAVSSAGLLGDQARAVSDLDHAGEIMRSNYERLSFFAEPPIITATLDEVGEAVFAGVDRCKDGICVRSVWLLVMLICRAISKRIFKRLKL
jgi:hypothetical protein